MDWAEVSGGCRVIVELPDADGDDLVAAGEVLAQEGLTVWTLPFRRRRLLPRLIDVFGRRVRFGVTDVRDADQVSSAIDAGADLVLSPFATPGMADAAGRAPLVLGGLTPTEVARAALLAEAVQVIPCDALGSMYARTVTAMFSDVTLIATGRLERFQCELWLEQGAAAVAPFDLITAADVEDPDLTDLRHRARSYRF